ncbi:S16 family serine protease [Kribbella sp. DT2]|uniref:S16 family serine protease n=1 Tax=Kribbella sp. DT2 TaxID=3393427 RepID=UPI003CF3DD37
MQRDLAADCAHLTAPAHPVRRVRGRAALGGAVESGDRPGREANRLGRRANGRRAARTGWRGVRTARRVFGACRSVAGEQRAGQLGDVMEESVQIALSCLRWHGAEAGSAGR